MRASLASCSYTQPCALRQASPRWLPRRHHQRLAPLVRAEVKDAPPSKKEGNGGASSSSSPEGGSAAEKVTIKYGLEAGLFKVFTSKEEGGSGAAAAGDAPVAAKSKAGQAKELLARYGGAYLLTSVSFAIVSFAACYAAVNAGVDVPALLARVGLQATDTSERVGTFAIAYAAHKALSPVRFPPTVALTPVVARMLGKGGLEQEQQQGEQQQQQQEKGSGSE